MKQIFRFGITAAAAVLFGSAVQAQPTYDLAISGPTSFSGFAGATLDLAATYDLNVTEAGNETAAGAQGWSLSVASSGAVSIDSITDAGTVSADVAMGGLRNTGFAVNETTGNALAGSACDGLGGAVQAIVLSFVMMITLPPNSTQNIGKITTSGSCTAPAADASEDAGSIAFANGCQGSGQPVTNAVTWSGNTINPALGSTTIRCVGLPPPQTCPADGNSLELTWAGAAVPAGDNGGSEADPATLDVDGVADGALGATTALVQIVSTDLASGVQGWSLSLANVGGDIEITAVTSEGTDAADVSMGGLRNTGFAVTETTTIAGAGTDCEGFNGAVEAIVLSFVMPITLPLTGTNSVLAVSVASTVPQPASADGVTPSTVAGTLAFRDGCRGSGQPVNSVATVAGNTETFDCAQALTVRFNGSVVPPTNLAAHCDPNDDGDVNLADAVWIINDLIRGGTPTACEASIDCNGDGLSDISDAVAIAHGLFGLATPPELVCEEVSSDICATSSSACAS